MHLGGTLLGTVNKGQFISRGNGRQGSFIPAEVLGKTRQTFQSLNINGLIVVGGDGSLNTALQMHNARLFDEYKDLRIEVDPAEPDKLILLD